MPSSKGKRTDPELAERIKEEVKAEEKGGGAGAWSAWKAGEMARRYEAQGGGYEDTPDSKNKAKKGAPEKKPGAEKGIHATKKAQPASKKRTKDDTEEDEQDDDAAEEDAEEEEEAPKKKGKAAAKKPATDKPASKSQPARKSKAKAVLVDEEEEEEGDADEQDEEEDEEEKPPKKKGKTAKGATAKPASKGKSASKGKGTKGTAADIDTEEIVEQFHNYVNMSVDELKTWLDSDDSQGAGWTGAAGGEETVGHQSGRTIVEILENNPDKDPSAYPKEHIAHMKKVNAYCKRHLAQEAHLKETKSKEELKETKSTKSLKNWGHDPLKTM